MYNSDGYVMIDMSDVDLTRSSQNIPGIYKKVLEVIDTNKLALIVNAGNNTPMAAVVHKKLNYYKITTLLYIFTINTNDIVIVEESGEATVDVEIVPLLTEGTKIADFAIGEVEGSLYAPSQQSEINDNVTAVNSTWSSSKINTELSAKADTNDLAAVATSGAYSDLTGTPNLAAVATSGSYSDLTGTPTIPVLTDLIDDTTASSSTVYSSNKVDTLLSEKADTSTTYTKTEVDTSLATKANNDITIYDNTERVIGSFYGSPLYRKCFVKNNFTIPRNGSFDITLSDYITGNIRLADIKMIIHAGNDYVLLPYGYADSSDQKYSINYAVNQSRITLSRGDSSDISVTDITVICEYIKPS